MRIRLRRQHQGPSSRTHPQRAAGSENLTHRGAQGCDTCTGAEPYPANPHEFLRRAAAMLGATPGYGEYGVGNCSCRHADSRPVRNALFEITQKKGRACWLRDGRSKRVIACKRGRRPFMRQSHSPGRAERSPFDESSMSPQAERKAVRNRLQAVSILYPAVGQYLVYKGLLLPHQRRHITRTPDATW